MAKYLEKKESISENIANLLNSAPAGFDEDDEEIDETSAKVLKDHYSDDNAEETLIERSKIRAQNVDLLESTDRKYAGKVGSRKRLRESSEESEGDFDPNIVNEDSEEGNTSQDDDDDVNEEASGSDLNSASENEEDETNFKHFKESNGKDQTSRGMCVKNQLNIWEGLLETRIQIQKCLAASNKLPAGEYFQELSQNGGEEYRNKLNESKKSISNVLDKMMLLQTLVIKKYPETKKILLEKQRTKEKIDGSDEEITSEENLSDEDNEEPRPKTLRKSQEYEDIIANRHETYKSFRNPTIQKWNEKSRIGTLSKNNSNSQTILNQIEHILCDKSKLIKKTQLKRSNFQILGEPLNDHNDIYNENIYDDNDFYHQLLHELIEFKTSDVTDPVQLGRQWIQLQSMRSKMKRKIDTKATKGRKIRYAVHSKLVNFMAPIGYGNTWTYNAKKELFSSLFGKKQM